MLFWRCKNAYDIPGHSFLVLSCIGHFFILLLIFIVYRTDTIVLVLTQNHPASLVSLKSSGIVKVPHSSQRSVASKKSQAGIEKTTAIAKPKNKKITSQPKRIRQKKIAKQKETTKKEIIKHNVVEQKKPEIKEIQSKPLPEPTVQTPKENLLTEPITPTTLAPIAMGELPEANSTLQDPLVMQCYKELHEELSRHWKPPTGIKPTSACHVCACVAEDGSIKTLTIAQSSGILVFDITARRTLLASQLPPWVKGKTITVVFK